MLRASVLCSVSGPQSDARVDGMVTLDWWGSLVFSCLLEVGRQANCLGFNATRKIRHSEKGNSVKTQPAVPNGTKNPKPKHSKMPLHILNDFKHHFGMMPRLSYFMHNKVSKVESGSTELLLSACQ